MSAPSQDALYDALKLNPGGAKPAPARPLEPAEQPRRPEAEAIVPNRVLILTVAEQLKLAHAMDYLARGDDLEASRLSDKLLYGDEYNDAQDELARITLRKRALENETRRANQRIEALNEIVVQELIDSGHSKATHAGTGATLALDQKIWAKVVKAGEKPTDEEKGAAGEGLIAAGLGNYVQPGFNTNSVSAYFRELIKTYNAEQQLLPEQERVPRSAASFLPPELEGLLELEDTPTIRVTAPRS
jgi:hypothetical protein